MSLYNDASLVMIPSAYKDGKLYSIKPTDGSGDFTFSRGSNLAATRVDENGLIEKGRENLLLQSNQFDTTWGSATSTLTSGQSGYDGSNDAWKIAKNQANAQINQSYSDTSVKTLSIYAKADTLNWVAIVGASGSIGYFDLANGVVGTIGASVINANIESIGNGWYRCSVASATTTSSVTIYPADGDNDISGTSGSIYIQDAQLEQGLVATDYIETTTTTAQAGILEDMPRLDYSGSCPSLLLEPTRTNSVVHSEYHSSGTYGNNYVTTTDNEAISPEGVQNAAKIVLDSGTNISNGGHHLSFNSTGGTTYTISVFAKAGEFRYFTFTYGSAAAGGGHFDLQEGTLLGTITNAAYSNETASIEDYGNGWYRLIVSLTDNITTSGRFLSMKPSPSASVPSNNNYSSTGDGTSGAYIYGFQLEQNASYATSYIPCYGAATTRSVDSGYKTSATSLIGQTQGTIFFDFVNSSYVSGNNVLFQLRISGGSGNQAQVDLRIASGTIRALANNGGVNQFSINGLSTSIGIRYKCALRYLENDSAFYINGVKVGSDTSCTFTSGSLDQISFSENLAALIEKQEINQLAVFKTALTDSELAALTTI